MSGLYLLASTDVAGDVSNANGHPVLRTVLLQGQLRTILCNFRSPWSIPLAQDKAAEVYAKTGVTLTPLAVTLDEFRNADNDVYGVGRAKDAEDKLAREQIFRDDAAVLLSSLGFSTNKDTRKKQLRALKFALSSVSTE